MGKLTALQNLLSIDGGDPDTLERVWLITQVSVYGTIEEMWIQVFHANGVRDPGMHYDFEKSARKFLRKRGFRGKLPIMWEQYWANGGGYTRLSWWKRIKRCFGIPLQKTETNPVEERL